MDSTALQDSWRYVAKLGDEVPLFFYSHLFLSHPEVRDMFPVSMAAQRDKLVGALGAVVSNADNLDAVVPVLQQLGRDHRRFGAVAEHYPAVGASLLATLQYFLGPQWTEELAGDWAAAYGLVAKVMVQAAEQAEADSPAWWLADVLGIERRTMDVAVIQLRPQERFDYAPGQSFAMEIPQRPRLWRYYSPANAPREDGTIELHVQLIAGGQVSTSMMRSLRTGDTVKRGAPVGVELFHGVRMPWSLYEHERLAALAQRPWFDYTPVVSDDTSYPGTRGLVGSVAAQSPRREGRRAMVCGSGGMVQHTVGELTRAGTTREDIRFDEFAKAGVSTGDMG